MNETNEALRFMVIKEIYAGAVAGHELNIDVRPRWRSCQST